MMNWHLLAQTAAERALNSVPEGLLIAATAWLMLKAFRKQSSRMRFAILFVVFVGIPALPFIPAPVSSLHTSLDTMTGASAEITCSSSWALGLFICWLVIAGIRLARVVAGMWGLRRLRCNAVEVSRAELPVTVQNAITHFQNVRKFTILRSADARVPMAIGFFKPAILIPEWAFDDLPAEDLNAVLLHEFAHLRRYDDWTNLAQKFIHALFFFHPAVWWIENKLALEREMACDELVLAEAADRHGYAACLVSIAEKACENNLLRRGLAMAQTAITHARQTSLRIARILDTEKVVPAAFKPVLAAGTGLAVLCLAALPHTPRLIAFRDSVPQQLASASNMIRTPMVNRPQAAESDSAFIREVGPKSGVRRSSLQSAQIVPVKQKQAPSRAAVLVRTAARQTAPQPQLLIFVQTTEYDGLGRAKVNYCVWRLTVTDEDHNTVRAEMIAKSI
jgi:beta-lactamase regulating signal transducer with metallopeptidase domain